MKRRKFGALCRWGGENSREYSEKYRGAHYEQCSAVIWIPASLSNDKRGFRMQDGCKMLTEWRRGLEMSRVVSSLGTEGNIYLCM